MIEILGTTLAGLLGLTVIYGAAYLYFRVVFAALNFLKKRNIIR